MGSLTAHLVARVGTPIAGIIAVLLLAPVIPHACVWPGVGGGRGGRKDVRVYT